MQTTTTTDPLAYHRAVIAATGPQSLTGIINPPALNGAVCAAIDALNSAEQAVLDATDRGPGFTADRLEAAVEARTARVAELRRLLTAGAR